MTLPNSFENNSVSGHRYHNATQAGTGNTASNTVTWVFPQPSVFAFGAEFFSANVDGLRLSGDFDGTGLQSIIVDNTMGGPDGFLGIVGDSAFGTVVLGSASTKVDSFSIDNASFA